MESHKNYNLNANEGFVIFLLPRYLLYWRFHFEKEIPTTRWEWTYILDFGPWKWSALNMGYMDKQPSRMQVSGQGQGAKALVFSKLPLLVALMRATYLLLNESEHTVVS